MTPKSFARGLIAAAILLVATQAAHAQAGGFYMGSSDNPVGPTVSPYLNLIQNNNSFGDVTNYQSLVKPLIDTNAALQRQGSSISRLQQQQNISAGGGRGTGHATYFMNYSHFYNYRTGR